MVMRIKENLFYQRYNWSTSANQQAGMHPKQDVQTSQLIWEIRGLRKNEALEMKGIPDGSEC